MTEREPDWDTIAEQEIESRRLQQFNCSDPPEESCSDAACPVHADGDDPDWSCCEHCDHDPGQPHIGECITCQYDLPDYDRR